MKAEREAAAKRVEVGAGAAVTLRRSKSSSNAEANLRPAQPLPAGTIQRRPLPIPRPLLAKPPAPRELPSPPVRSPFGRGDNVRGWTVQQTVRWLESNELADFAKTFAHHCFGGEQLVLLEKLLGLTTSARRTTLLDSIATLLRAVPQQQTTRKTMVKTKTALEQRRRRTTVRKSRRALPEPPSSSSSSAASGKFPIGHDYRTRADAVAAVTAAAAATPSGYELDIRGDDGQVLYGANSGVSAQRVTNNDEPVYALDSARGTRPALYASIAETKVGNAAYNPADLYAVVDGVFDDAGAANSGVSAQLVTNNDEPVYALDSARGTRPALYASIAETKVGNAAYNPADLYAVVDDVFDDAGDAGAGTVAGAGAGAEDEPVYDVRTTPEWKTATETQTTHGSVDAEGDLQTTILDGKETAPHATTLSTPAGAKKQVNGAAIKSLLYRASWHSPEGTTETPVFVPVIICLTVLDNMPTMIVDHATEKANIHTFPIAYLSGYAQRNGRLKVATGPRCLGGSDVHRYTTANNDVAIAMVATMKKLEVERLYRASWHSPEGTAENPVFVPVIMYVAVLDGMPTLIVDYGTTKENIHTFPIEFLRGYSQRDGSLKLEAGPRCPGGPGQHRYTVGKNNVAAAMKTCASARAYASHHPPARPRAATATVGFDYANPPQLRSQNPQRQRAMSTGFDYANPPQLRSQNPQRQRSMSTGFDYANPPQLRSQNPQRQRAMTTSTGFDYADPKQVLPKTAPQPRAVAAGLKAAAAQNPSWQQQQHAKQQLLQPQTHARGVVSNRRREQQRDVNHQRKQPAAAGRHATPAAPPPVPPRSSRLEEGAIVQAPAGAPAPLDATNALREASSQVESNAAMLFMSDILSIAEQNFRWQASTNDEDDRRHAALHGVDADALIASAAAAHKMAPIGSTAHRKQSVRILKAQEKWVTSQKEQGSITEQADAGDSAVPWNATKRSLAPWFRGVGYTRTNAESELAGRAVGTYMIRVSESRCGYTLTCLQEKCVRHYPIDETGSCSFKLRGSNEKEFDSLPNLIAFYERESLSCKHPTEKLSGPIGKVSADDDNDGAVEYAELRTELRT